MLPTTSTISPSTAAALSAKCSASSATKQKPRRNSFLRSTCEEVYTVATPALEETDDLAPAFFDTIDHDWMIRFLEHRIEAARTPQKTPEQTSGFGPPGHKDQHRRDGEQAEHCKTVHSGLLKPVLLSAASQREDRGIELAPNLRGGAAQKLVRKLSHRRSDRGGRRRRLAAGLAPWVQIL